MPYVEFISNRNFREMAKGSSRYLVYYLEKENRGKDFEDKAPFYDRDLHRCSPAAVYRRIDEHSAYKMSKSDVKYYTFFIALSEKEIDHIGDSDNAVKAYGSRIFDIYAENFNRGLSGGDIVGFFKIERERYFKPYSPEALDGHAEPEAAKAGRHTHLHFIVSRRSSDLKYKLSPLAKPRNTTNRVTLNGKKVVVGFDRKAFISKAEALFDRLFDYHRSKEESFEYLNARKKASGKAHPLRPHPSESELHYKRRVSGALERALRTAKSEQDFRHKLKNKGIHIERGGDRIRTFRRGRSLTTPIGRYGNRFRRARRMRRFARLAIRISKAYMLHETRQLAREAERLEREAREAEQARQTE